MFKYAHIQTAGEAEFVKRGTELLEQKITGAIVQRGQCILGLSGGSTPGPIYAELATAPHSDSLPRGERMIDWSKVYVFLVDERYVPKDHEESNQRLVTETLLASARIPRSNLLFPKTTLGLENCVADYEERLRSLFAEGPPDIVVLGMGDDGHIASLFPGNMTSLREKQRMVLHVQQDRLAVRDRITIALPLLLTARSILFFLKGKGKRKIFEEMMQAPFDPIRYPAHTLLQTGRTAWITEW